jgi:hypothetical protein
MHYNRLNAGIKGMVLIGCLVVMSGKACASDKIKDVILDDYRLQYNELEKALSESKNPALSKKISSEEEKICNRQALILESDNSPLDVVIRRTEALIDDLSRRYSGFNGTPFRLKLSGIKKEAGHVSGLSKTAMSAAEVKQSDENLYLSVSKLRRAVALANPKINFDTLLFAGVVKAVGEYHMCDQYLAKNARNGGGLYLLTGVKSGKVTVVDLLKDNKVVSGDFAGKTLSGGAALSPDLSFDGKTIAFAWTNETDICFHIFKMNIDGSNLVQLKM